MQNRQMHKAYGNRVYREELLREVKEGYMMMPFEPNLGGLIEIHYMLGMMYRIYYTPHRQKFTRTKLVSI